MTRAIEIPADVRELLDTTRPTEEIYPALLKAAERYDAANKRALDLLAEADAEAGAEERDESNYLVVTDGDVVLCATCYREGFDDNDPATYAYDYIRSGVCSSCGRVLPKTGGDEC